MDNVVLLFFLFVFTKTNPSPAVLFGHLIAPLISADEQPSVADTAASSMMPRHMACCLMYPGDVNAAMKAKRTIQFAISYLVPMNISDCSLPLGMKRPDLVAVDRALKFGVDSEDLDKVQACINGSKYSLSSGEMEKPVVGAGGSRLLSDDYGNIYPSPPVSNAVLLGHEAIYDIKNNLISQVMVRFDGALNDLRTHLMLSSISAAKQLSAAFEPSSFMMPRHGKYMAYCLNELRIHLMLSSISAKEHLSVAFEPSSSMTPSHGKYMAYCLNELRIHLMLSSISATEQLSVAFEPSSSMTPRHGKYKAYCLNELRIHLMLSSISATEQLSVAFEPSSSMMPRHGSSISAMMIFAVDTF